ncbi:hypothetical protein EON82_20290 [bacterium]|nr:MAG: hypothetical protein EON82_20290 [bacterium]
MDKQPIVIPPDILEKYGQPKDGFDFDATVRTILSVKAEDVPDVSEFERRPKRKNGEGKAERQNPG